MEHMGWLSLLPPIIAVLLAVITKNVIISLFSGVYVGVLMLVGGRPLEATMQTIGEFMFPQVRPILYKRKCLKMICMPLSAITASPQRKSPTV